MLSAPADQAATATGDSQARIAALTASPSARSPKSAEERDGRSTASTCTPARCRGGITHRQSYGPDHKPCTKTTLDAGMD
jgi:hypothetical protein